jgi:hypothetical protein
MLNGGEDASLTLFLVGMVGDGVVLRPNLGETNILKNCFASEAAPVFF